MVAIVFASALVFASFGFKPRVDAIKADRRLKVFQSSFIVSGSLVLCMLALLVSQTISDIREVDYDNEIQTGISNYFDEIGIKAKVNYWSMSTTKNGISQLAVQVESPKQISRKEVDVLEKRLTEGLNKSISLDLTVLPVKVYHVD